MKRLVLILALLLLIPCSAIADSAVFTRTKTCQYCNGTGWELREQFNFAAIPLVLPVWLQPPKIFRYEECIICDTSGIDYTTYHYLLLSREYEEQDRLMGEETLNPSGWLVPCFKKSK